jgi:hypothetical protein
VLSLQGTGFLLAALCDQLGLCLPPEARVKVVEQAPPDPKSFVDAVFASEGLERSPSHRASYGDALALAERAFADHARPDTSSST